MSYFQSNELAFKEIETRRGLRAQLLSFGVDFLDDALNGISKNDLILIGASSGAGKTELACNIAKANIEKGKRVHYIALEAELYEIEKRIKYQIFSQKFFEDPDRPRNISISFSDWMLGDFLDSCEKYEAQAASEFAKNYYNLFTYYKQEDFTVSDFVERVLLAYEKTDLIILDHVHYFDYDDDNENRAMKTIAKTARMLTLEYGKPIILIAHLRKRDRWAQEKTPGLEEFHGSSDLYKIATKTVTIAPGGWSANGKYETFFRAAKHRFGGSVVRYMASCNYLLSEGKYEKGYRLGEANQKRDEEFRELDSGIYPKWAKNSGSICGSSDFVPEKPRSPQSILAGPPALFPGAKKGRKY